MAKVRVARPLPLEAPPGAVGYNVAQALRHFGNRKLVKLLPNVKKVAGVYEALGGVGKITCVDFEKVARATIRAFAKTQEFGVSKR